MPGGYPSSWEICNGTDVGTVAASSIGTAVSSSATPGVYSGYTQLVASSAVDACFISVGIEGGNFNFSNNVMVKIAVGGAGSEVDIIKDLILYDGGTSQASVRYAFPIAIPAGTRISTAVAPQAGGSDTVDIQVTLFDGAYTQIEGCAGVDSIGFSSTHGTTVTAGAANTKGSYAQLTASTSKDYLGFCFTLDGNGSATFPPSAALWDIAIGGAGSEIVILPNYLNWNAITSAPTPSSMSPVFPIQIPAGTRVAARYQNTAGGGNTGITLYGIYQ